MSQYYPMIIAFIISWIIFAVSWRIFFGSRTRTTAKANRKSAQKLKDNLSISARKDRNKRYKAISDALNYLQIGKLTPQKKQDIDAKLATIHNDDGAIRIAEELHVLSFGYAFIFLVFIAFCMYFWRGFGMLVLAMPWVFNIPYSSLNVSTSIEAEALESEFINFYNVYFVQFGRVGTQIRLVDVVKSYKNLCPPEMKSFCTRIEVDLASSEDVALRMLDRRYPQNADIRRFCAVAASVSRGDPKAATVIDSLQQELQRRDVQRREAIVAKRMELVEKVQSALLYGIVFCLLGIVFYFTAVG